MGVYQTQEYDLGNRYTYMYISDPPVKLIFYIRFHYYYKKIQYNSKTYSLSSQSLTRPADPHVWYFPINRLIETRVMIYSTSISLFVYNSIYRNIIDIEMKSHTSYVYGTIIICIHSLNFLNRISWGKKTVCPFK